jgi:hypothetical protein
MSKVEKVVSAVYLTGGVVLAMVVIMSMSSCGSSKSFHIGTGKELSKSRCTGGYMYQ